MNAVVSEQMSIFVRPHFRNVDGKLSFFLSERVYRALTDQEAEIWSALQAGPRLLRDLPHRSAVQSLVDSGVAESVVPIEAEGRRRVLVVEPHADDAALSIGGTMWKRRGEYEFHLLTMASETNYTSDFHLKRGFFDRARVTAMRRMESEIFMAHLGGGHAAAGLSEATLRYRDDEWSLDFFRDHRVSISASNNRRAEPSILAEWQDVLQRQFEAAHYDEIWLPLGAGTHGDHDLTRNAALGVLSRYWPEATVRLYEDVPYGTQFSAHTARLLELFDANGTSLEPWTQDITDDYAQKLKLLSIFASQFKVGSIEGGVERSARQGTRLVERLWTMRAVPADPSYRDMWIHAAAVTALAPAVGRFRAGPATVTAVAIFAINAPGRWTSDLARLKSLFPRAVFRIYASPATRAEFEAAADPRVSVRVVLGSARSWIIAALRESLTTRRIVIAGDAMRNATFLRRLWPFGITIVVAEMETLYQALERSGGSAES